MKKTFLVLAAVLFSTSLFFSCASKPKAETENEITVPEEIETPSDSEESEEPSDTEDSADAETDIIESATETEDEEVISEESGETEELEEIQEPEVTEIELPPVIEEEPVSEEENSDEDKDFTETDSPVEPEEIITLPELPEEPEKTEEKETVPEVSDTDTSISVLPPSDYDADEVEDVEDSENNGNEEENPEQEESAPAIIPSRNVSMKNGESLDVEYPGKGWIYLGCTDGSKNLVSSGRKIGSQNTNFTLIAKVPGTVILHFYKEDLLAEKYIDDYLEVTVSEIRSKSSVHVKAPSYAEVVPKKPETKTETKIETKTENVSETKKETVPEEKTPVKTEPAKKQAEIISEPEAEKPVEKTVKTEKNESTKVIKQEQKKETKQEEKKEIQSLGDPEEYLKKARTALDEKNYSDCYNNLQIFLKIADKNKDEAYFLLGQVYESNSELKNIKSSIENYQEVTKNYPLSKFYDAAEKRIVYLKRFYINIR